MHLTLHQTSQIEPETGRIQTPKQVKKVIWERKLHKSASNCMFWEGFPFRHVIRNDIFSNHVRITWVRITAVTQNSSHRGFSSHRGHQKSSKIIKSDPMATQKHQKCALKSLEFQLLWKVGFCNPSHTKCLVLNPILKKKVQTRIRKSDFLFSGNSSSIFLKYFSKKNSDPAFWNHYLKDISLIRQRYSLIRRENVLIRREYARGRMTQIPPRPQQSHPKSYKVVPRPPKHINIGPKIQQNSNICEKLVFATPFTPNACFWSPRRPDSDPKII